MTRLVSIFFLLCEFFSIVVSGADRVQFENVNFRYVISADGKNLEFIDRATGSNYLRSGSSCATVRIQGKEHAATSASLKGDRLTLRFANSTGEAIIKIESNTNAIVFGVESIAEGDVDAITFLNIPLNLKGVPSDAFGACALALNLNTHVDALPALQSQLLAMAEKKFGIIGARAAIVAAPVSRMLAVLQATLSKSSELPICKTAGPWAREVEFNHGSYLFNFGSLTESKLYDWIERVHRVGFTQIDNHGGGSFFRFGDMELDRKKWPDGWETWRRIVSRLHATNIGSIFHTYAFFIDKRSKYVTPIPDRRLDAFRTFTLAMPLDAATNEIFVNESTADIRTVTGFFEHNSVALHIGDELVTFGGATKQPPWKFTEVKRGVLGTTAASHSAGSAARHLKECFGLFVPDVDSSLFSEIASNHAYVVNLCGFDGIYLDAIDGSSILRGDNDTWYWASKFVVEIERNLKRPIGMEMSSMLHHFWQYRTRWQAWDYPQRGHARFIDLHARDINGGLLLPLHLGWWSFQSYNPPQIEPSYPDVIENLGAKLIGWDAGISLTASVDKEALGKTPLFARAAEILQTCENLRHTHKITDEVRAKLREPGAEFSLFTDRNAQPRFRRVKRASMKICMSEPWTATRAVTNEFNSQPARFRIEALTSVAPETDTNAIVLADDKMLSASNQNAGAFRLSSAQGITARIERAGTDGYVTLVVTNAGIVDRKAAWVRLEKAFEPSRSLRAQQGLCAEVEADGSGALLAVRLESPQHLSFGALADRYLPLDFAGRRKVALVETESTRWSDFEWEDKKSLYNAYRETIDFDSVSSVSVWLQNIPAGREIKCSLGRVWAVPLRTAPVKNPKVTIAGKLLEFPVTLESGSWIEANGPEDCSIYGPKGERLGKVSPHGDWPSLPPGQTALEFNCESDGVLPVRAIVTVFFMGEGE